MWSITAMAAAMACLSRMQIESKKASKKEDGKAVLFFACHWCFSSTCDIMFAESLTA